jgi:hypothetical protein
MKIGHITTWSPNTCGLTEASFNMMKADFLNRHEVFCVDTGINADLKPKKKSSVGEVVNRKGFLIKSMDPQILNNVDLIIQHTWIPDKYLSYTEAPIIYINHGRPEAAYLQEFKEQNMLAFTAYGHVTYFKRVKKMVYFWPEYTQYWEIVCNKDKLIALDYPAIDGDIFKKDKGFIPPEKLGELNGLICDGNRTDINRFDLFIGAIKAAEKFPKLKWHFIGLDNPINAAEERLLNKLQQMGNLGLVLNKIKEMNLIYNSVDFLYTNQKIITQIVGECVSCGTKVIAENGNKIASQTIDTKNPIELIGAIENINNFENKPIWSLKKFGEEMNNIYNDIIR